MRYKGLPGLVHGFERWTSVLLLIDIHILGINNTLIVRL